MPAFPTVENGQNRIGLTKREYFAAMALQGMFANGFAYLHSGEKSENPAHFAKMAVWAADSILIDLSK